MLMVDYLTCETPDPFGRAINDGFVCRVRPDGSLHWSTVCKKQLLSSHNASVMVRALGVGGDGVGASGIQISGNPAKFLQGHNLFGTDCPLDLLRQTFDRIGPELWPLDYYPEELDLGATKISRIDLTGSWQVERPDDVKPLLRAMEERIWMPFRGRGRMDSGGSTLYFGMTDKGKRAKDWAIKVYWKGAELGAHPLPERAMVVPGLLDDVNRWVRVELTLRTAELKRLGLTTVVDWSREKVREIWDLYVAKMDFGDFEMMDRGIEDLAALPEMKPRHVTAVAAWRAGHDLRSFYRSSSTLYRLRNEVLALTGIDIFIEVPKSNVVPLRRVVSVSPVLQPHWADHLTAALARAA